MDIFLKKLELHGFKSFPEKTLVKFHKGITAVVGPNGCGKSNLVDALLWVLGEQRIKNLRGENNEDLIFNGSVSKKPLGMTEVEASITNAGEDVYIARRYFRTGESKYILNEKYCRNKDIQDELFKMHLGERKYFIFEQGSIEKLISLKPVEMRMLIEEAANISQYLERKKETTNKLIIAEQNLDNIEILISDKKNRLKELKNQANYVERYRKIKENKIDFLKSLLKKKYNTHQKEFNHLKSDIEGLINQEIVFIKEISNSEKELLNKEETRWNIDKELKNNQKNYFDAKREILSKKSEIEKSQQRKDFINQKIIEVNNSIENEKKELSDIESQIHLEEENIKILETKLEKEKSSYGILKNKLSKLKNKIKSLDISESDLKGNIFNLQAEISQFNNKIQDIEKKIGRIENEVLTKNNFITELKNQISSKNIKSTETDFINLNKQYQNEQTQFKKIETEFKKSINDVETLEIEQKNIKNEKLNLENQKLKYLEIKKKIVGNNTEITGIKNQIFLHDLIKADKKHYRMIENFYYDEMDALVIGHNEEILKINFNKLLLNRENIRDFPQEIKKEVGFISFIKDLFTLKDQHKKKYLKNGVLVDNIKNGINIFIKYGIDVLTLDSEIINNNGLLIRNREKGILDVINEIIEIDDSITKLRKKSEIINKNLIEEVKKQTELKKNLERERSKLNSYEEKQIILKTKLETLKKNREINLKRVKISESEIELLLIEQKKFQNELKEMGSKKIKLEKDFQSVTEERENFNKEKEINNVEISKNEKILFQNENSINLLKEKLNSRNNNIKISKNNKEKLFNNIKSNQQTILNLKNDLIKIDTNKKNLKDNIEILNQKKDNLDKVIKSQEKKFNSLNSEITSSTANLSERRKHLEEIKEKKNKVEINLHSIKKDLFQLEDISFKELNMELKNIEAPEQLIETKISESEEKVKEYDERLIRMRDSNKLNFSADSEYNILKKDYDFLNTQKEDIIKSIQDMNDAIQRIDNESKTSFLDAFNKVRKNFSKNFQILFEGGESEINISNSNGNILESGLEIKAQPPGKRLQSLKLLSGGEKALTSLAFLFALFEYKPSPFCVFDEVDASLDEANIQKFLKFLHKLKEKTQFLIITHNFKTMEEADYLYGISMDEPGISTIYSIKMTGRGGFHPEQLE